MESNLFPRIYELIKEDKVKESLEFLMEKIPEKSKEWVLFINRINALEQSRDLGTLSLEEYNPEKAKIIYGLTHLLDSVTSRQEAKEQKESGDSGELVTDLVRDQIDFLKSRIRELNLFQIGLGIFTTIVFVVSALYLFKYIGFLKDINVHLFSIVLFVLYFLIILVSLFLIHLTKGNLSDNQVKFSTYRKIFRKIKI